MFNINLQQFKSRLKKFQDFVGNPCYASITNSCTDITEYECRKCWWCQERKWAAEESIPADWRCPPDTFPLTFYGQTHRIDRKWRDGVVWSMDGYKKRLEIEEEFPPPL